MDDLKSFAEQVCQKFNTKIVAITIRYPDTFEKHRWETAVRSSDGFFFRSPSVKEIVLLDRLGGGDSLEWRILLQSSHRRIQSERRIEKGVLVGDAFPPESSKP